MVIGFKSTKFLLVAHDSRGVNWVDYYPQADKPYLITTSDDKTIKVWDYQTKSCVATLEGHLANVSFAIFHPELPIIISGSEDSTVKFWNSNTFKLEKSINYGIERVWCCGLLPKSNVMAVGCDSGFVILKLGNEEPLFSMDSNMKLIYGKNSEVFQLVIKPSLAEGLKDGEALPLQQRDLGLIEIYPQSLRHSPNGRYATVCGDGEYIVYTALSWRSKSYGKALDFVWNSHDFSNACSFAIRESTTSVKIYKNFEETITIDLIYQADKIFAGSLLGIKLEGCISFYDWNSGKLVRRVDLDDFIHDVVWSDNGELVAILTTTSGQNAEGGVEKASGTDETYFLSYDHAVFEAALNEDAIDVEEGVEDTFNVLYTLPTLESILSGKFIGDVFVYTTSTSNRLNYFVGGEVINLGHFDHKYYIIGYKAGTDGKLYLIDKSFNVISWFVNAEVLELQTLVMRGDLEQFATKFITLDDEEAEEGEEVEQIPDLSAVSIEDLSEEYSTLLKSFNKTESNQLSRFFEKLGYLSLSYALSQDFDSKFQISLSTNNLKQAYELLVENQQGNASLAVANSAKWKKLAKLAMSKWQIKLAQDCYWLANDYNSLLLLLSSTNNHKELTKLAEQAELKGKYNIAWQAWWLTGNTEKCYELLIKSDRLTEAAIFGSNYGQESKVDEVLKIWKEKLVLLNKSGIAERLQTPQQQQSLIDLDDKPNGSKEEPEVAEEKEVEESQEIEETPEEEAEAELEEIEADAS